MKEPGDPDWDPMSDWVLEDQVAAYDDMRRRCPVAYSEALGWSLFRHEDVLRALEDHETFSNAVSRHRSVPNGMDPPEHAAYRRAIEPFFDDERMQDFAPACRRIAGGLLESLAGRSSFDCVQDFADPFAVRCQCAFLGWPEALAERIRDWTRRNQTAALERDGAALALLAVEFQSFIEEVLEDRRRTEVPPRSDVTTSLMELRVNGAPLSDDELTSVLRNWTAGEVGSLAASLGIVVHHLALHGALQEKLRSDPSLLPAAIDEILRLSGPLVLNRRVARRDVEIGGRRIAAGERVSLIWVAANRDDRAFEAADELRLERDPRGNLLYGAGIHVCPGAPLARLELRVALEELLARSRQLELSGESGRRARYPANGWASLSVRLG
ncbi:MAG TPA: cytochrome P450 [Polyangiaceae bacterium]